MNRFREIVRQAFMIAALLATAFYLVYRAAFTFNMNGAYAIFASLCLYAAECYGALLMSLYYFSIWKTVDPEPVEAPPGRTVDVFIPTFNEDPELLRGTIVAALALDYPHETYVLDDGKRPEVRELTERLGATYIERPDNQHAKAGNLNHALGQTRGEFVVILDADHVAQRNFIVRLLGYFGDDRIAYVQTPHSFYNFDSFQGTLDYSQQVYWEDGQLFYNVIQPGKNYWNSATFCGSAAIFRRSALDEVGGFATETITEDMHTGVRLHAQGWKSLFVNERLVSGQAATDITTFNTQRLRWGEGNLSIFAFDNPLTIPGLSLGQRISYLGSMLSWTTGVQKLLLYLAPMLMLITGIAPVKEFNLTLGAVTLTYLAAIWTAFKVTGNGYGHLFGTELTQMASFWTQIRATYRAFLRRKHARFEVTSKRGRQSNRLIYYIAPQCLLIAGSAIAIACASLRWWYGFTDDLTCLAVGTGLLLFHGWFAWNVVRRALRANDGRFSWRHPAAMHVAYSYLDPTGTRRQGQAVSVDINERGLGVIAMEDLSGVDQVELNISAGGRNATTKASVRLVQPVLPKWKATLRGAQAWRVGFAFEDASEETLALVWWMAATYAVSRQYDRFHSGLPGTPPDSVEKVVRRQAEHESTIQLPVELRSIDEKKRFHAVSERLGLDTVWLTLAEALPEGSAAKVSMETPFGPVEATGTTTEPVPAHLGGEEYFVQACQLQSVPSESQLVLKKTLREAESSRLGRIIRYSPEKMDLPTLRPGTLLGATAAVAAAVAIVANLWLFKDDILVARALASGKVTAEELEQLEEITQRLINDPAPNEQRVLRVREVMRVIGNSTGLRQMDEFLAAADFTSFQGRLTRAQALDELGEHKAAGELLAQLLEQRGELTDQEMRNELLISAARNMTNREEYQKASEFLDELAATGADTSRYRLERVSVLGALGEIEQVEEILGGTNDRADRTRLASIFSANQRFDRAADTYLDIAGDDPADSDSLAMAANNALWGGRFETAAQIYGRLLERDNTDHDVQTGFARASLWADQPDRALPVLAQLIQRDEAEQEETLLFLEAVAASDTVDQAHRQLVLQIHDEWEDYLGNLVFIKRLADAMSRIGENEAAIPILQVIVESEDTNHAMRLRLAEALRAAGRFEEAEDQFQRLLAESNPVH